MKNSAVHAMMAKQFENVELDNIRVKFEASFAGIEEYEVTILENDVIRKFEVNVEMKEIEQ